MKKIHILLLIAVLLLVLVSYILWQVNLLSKSVWKYGGFKIKSLGLDKVVLSLYFKVDYKGSIDMVLTQQDYDVYVNDHFVSKVSNSTDVMIYANTVSRVPFDVTLKPGDVLKAGVNSLAAIVNKSEREKIRIKIKGILTLKVGYFTIKKLPFEKEENLKDVLSDTGQ